MAVLPSARVVVLAGGLGNCSFQVPLQQMENLGLLLAQGPADRCAQGGGSSDAEEWGFAPPQPFAWREMLRRGY